ncbi:MAG: TonB family protein, partial [Rhodothermaceae bacterium]|nr:TonB family protein [Rhodothermaceae bacterium]
ALSADYQERPQTIAAFRGMLIGAVMPSYREELEAVNTLGSEVIRGDGGLMDHDEKEPPLVDEITIHTETNGLHIDMEDHGREMSKKAVVPSSQNDQLPARKDKQEKDLQARLSELENKQKGFSRLFIAALVFAFMVATGLYFGPGIVNQFSSIPSTEPIKPPTEPKPEMEPIETGYAANALLAAVPEIEEEITADSTIDVEPPPLVEPVPVSTPEEVPVVSQPASTQVEAILAERQAIALENERRYQYHRGKGDVLFELSQWDEALDAYTEALEFQPGDLYATQRMIAARDSVEQSSMMAEVEIEKERQYQYYRGQGDILFQEQRWENALGAYASALEVKPEDEYLLERMRVARDSVDAVAQALEKKIEIEKLIDRVTDENGIFVVPDSPARLLEEAALRAGVEYPSRARRAGVEGRVIIRMIVDEEGRMLRPAVVEGIGFGCDEEVIKALGNAQFEPATFRSQPVKSWYMFSLVFSLE